jgi:hypothetical protein
MHYSTLLTSLAALATVFAHPTTDVRARGKAPGCLTEPTPEFLAAAREMNVQELNGTIARVSTADFSAAATITVPVYFHVVAKSTSLSGGYIPTSQLTSQLQVMNDNYAPHGISFVLQGTDYTVNSAWATDGAELTMKKTLRKGDYKTLNIYFQYSLVDDAFGYCYFPTSVTTGSNDFYYDGCTILFSTVPGGSSTNFNEGKTVTHEVGHCK